MKELCRLFLIISTVIGGGLIFLAISTSDYYVLELGESKPAWLVRAFVIGWLMLIPFAIHIIRCAMKGVK